MCVCVCVCSFVKDAESSTITGTRHSVTLDLGARNSPMTPPPSAFEKSVKKGDCINLQNILQIVISFTVVYQSHYVLFPTVALAG